ncbi:MAG: isoleucine--tRNA ligase [Dehalococcoidia bacterium]|nr:isoleucine--tRNA ligase [Dehalococcoidia bacterium]
MFKPVSSRVNFALLEEEVLQLWRERDIQRRSEEEKPADAPTFMLFDGPPTANGNPGIHHVLSRVFKDIIPRYKAMQGYRPIRKGGWDTHGLPVELEVEKELGITTKQQVEEYGIEAFNARCRESVFRYVQEWEALTERVGYWVDMKHPYVTLDRDYMESCWWIIKRLWERDLLYEGFRVTPHCPRCVTSLSSHEVALGYQENTPDPSAFVRFRLSDIQGTGSGGTGFALAPLGYRRGVWEEERPCILAWTTTPWTLTANVALAVNPDEEYALVQAPLGKVQERLIIAKARKDAVLGPDWAEICSMKGSDLHGLFYNPLYPTALAGYLHHVVPADFVSMEDGTGVVHIAPAYGAEDMELGRAYSLPTLHTVDLQGNLAKEGLPGSGKFVKEADEDIMQDLHQRGLLYKREVIRHTYPFCWRCNTPLLYYAKSSWYIRTTNVKDRLISGNQEINWYPEHVKEGRFGEWLRGNVDWALSRERYWGTPMPVWRCERDPQHLDCVGSVEELQGLRIQEDNAAALPDLHRPFIDAVVLRCTQCGGAMRRIPDVMDAWFDSGAMPFAQAHVMSDGDFKELREQHLFPADYICEAVDQTRGWFYTLHALSTLIIGEPSYRNVICLGLILDEQGEKMSKSRGNVVNPWEVIRAHGADPLRWYLYTATAPGNARRFSSPLVGETVRRFFLTLWNTYSFFVTYANLDGYDPKAAQAAQPTSNLDRWALSRLNTLVTEVTALLDEYNPTDAGRRIEEFTEEMSNWYVRRSRRRFWKSGNDADKASAYATLYQCMVTVAHLMAPFTPFLAEAMYQNLVRSVDPQALDSVHLSPWPKADPSLVDEELVKATALAIQIASLGRAARSKAKVKVRQPLRRVWVKPRTRDEEALLQRVADQVSDELNVSELALLEEEEQVLQFRVRLNQAVAGPRYGSRTPQLARALAQEDASAIARRVRAGDTVEIDGLHLQPDDLLVESQEGHGFAVAQEGGYLVALETTLTPELLEEGLARELVHRVQNLRREAGFDIADRITLWYGGSARVRQVVERFADYIQQETLAERLVEGVPPAGAFTEALTLEGEEVTLGAKRTGG